ncbi:MAG: nucleotidyltransferase family protein [Candidatus Acetothermia bacterium]
MEGYFTNTMLNKAKTIQALKPFTQNLTGEYHLRELARELEVNHQTLRPYLDTLIEKEIMRERSQGRNKLFSLRHKSDLLPYYLVQAETNRTAEYLSDKKVIRAFWKNFMDRIAAEAYLQIETLVLFGSFTKGTETKTSDIDLFLAAPDAPSRSVKTVCDALEDITGREIEIEHTSDLGRLVLHEQPGTFQEIVSDHIVLLGVEKFVYSARRFQGV